MIFAQPSYRHGEVTWQDSKRYLWLLSVLSPAVPLICALAFAFTGQTFWAFGSIIIYFGLVPLLDLAFGEDTSNPPEAIVEELSGDSWYRILLFASLPVFYASLIAAAWAATSLDVGPFAFIALAAGAGVASGAALTVGHELGHKPARADQWGAKLALALTGYAHFSIEHNRGHHVMVATPEDPASSRFGESVYRFALREIPGAAVRGWRLERERLARKGLPFWHWRNALLQGYALAALIVGALTLWLGPAALLFLAIHHPVGWLQLTFANYVEHYGLKRPKRADGRYGACEPRHSWNTNHIVSNLLLFHLQRHSDHHANPLRPYQALRDFHELPRLPSGYPGSYVLASIPPLWFGIMNPRVMAWADGDLSKVNTGHLAR